MNKKLFVSAGAVAATAVVNAHVIHAEEIETINTTPTTEVSTVQQFDAQKEKLNQVEQTISVVKQSVEEKEQALLDAETQKKQSQEQVDRLSSDITTAEKLVEMATDEKIDSLNQSIKHKQQKVEQATKELNDAQRDQAQREIAVSQQQNVVDDSKSDYNRIIQTVDKLTTEVAVLENTLKTLTPEETERAVNEAMQGVDKAQAIFTDASDALITARQKDKATRDNLTNATRELTDANNVVTAAQESVAQKEAELLTQQKDQIQAQQVVDGVKKDLETAQQDKYPTQITLSQEWLNAFKVLYERSNYNAWSDDDVQAKAAFETLEKISRSQVDANPFTVFGEEPERISDTAVRYDVNNLPEELQYRLNLYFAQLVNSIHEQLGHQNRMVMNKNFINAANVTAQGYAKLSEEEYLYHLPSLDWVNGGHHVPSINAGAKSANFIELKRWNLFENRHYSTGFTNLIPQEDLKQWLSLFGHTYKTATEEQLYSWVYSSVTGFFLRDADDRYGHALSIIKDPVSGVGISYVESVSGYNVTVFSGDKSNYLGKELSEGGSLYEINQELIKLTAEALRYELNTSNRESELFDTLFESKPIEVGWNDYVDSISIDNSLYPLVIEYKEIKQQKKEYEEKIALLKPQIKAAQERADAEYERLFGVNSSDNLKDVVKDVSALQEAYNTALATLNRTKDDVVVAEAALKNSQQLLQIAKERQNNAQIALQNAQNVPLEVPNAQQTVDNAKAELQRAQATLQEAQNQLANLDVVRQQTIEQLKNTKATLSRADADKQQVMGTLQREEDVLKALMNALNEASQLTDDKQRALNEAIASLQTCEHELSELLAAPEQLEKLNNAYNESLESLNKWTTIVEQRKDELLKAQVELAQLSQQYGIEREIYENLKRQMDMMAVIEKTASSNADIVPKRLQKSEKTQTQLPQTNSEASIWLQSVGVSAVGGAVMLRSRRNHRQKRRFLKW